MKTCIDKDEKWMGIVSNLRTFALYLFSVFVSEKIGARNLRLSKSSIEFYSMNDRLGTCAIQLQF